MRSRPWPWLRTHIVGLLTKPTSVDAAGYPKYANRVQELVFAKPEPQAQHAAQQ